MRRFTDTNATALTTPSTRSSPTCDRDPVFVAVDVQYDGDLATAAIVAARDRGFADVAWARTAPVRVDAPYEPGRFYLRELPALRAVIPARDVELIVVDGYVDLDPNGRPGLGAHVHRAYGVPVVGVAKTPFRSATHAAVVRRGASARPLYVTAAGMPVAEAADMVRTMSGRHRIPDALKRTDRLARGLEPPDPGPASAGAPSRCRPG